MPWNWQLPMWPIFTYKKELIAKKEKEFLLKSGSSFAFLKSIEEKDYKHFVVEILSMEGLESSKIEGEYLDRESLQSSIRQHFGINTKKKQPDKESKMADLLCGVYDNFDKPLSHEMLYHWHKKLFDDKSTIDDLGKYRTHTEPMQIVSSRYDSRKVFFEAPPSKDVFQEMDRFINWFNDAKETLSTLERVSVAHVYFESIHPFEDGNGRIGRLIVEKGLSQGVDKPVLIAVSKILEKKKKEYYAALEKCNKTLDVNDWLMFFADAIIEAQEHAMKLLNFLIEKSKILSQHQYNERQEKVLLRMFLEGLSGFKGGLSAENYIRITKTSRATATRDLSDLVEKDVFVKKGSLRHTRYQLKIASEGQ